MADGGGAICLVVCGPSGVGKGTVIAQLRQQRPDIWLSVSATTRTPRPGEQDGVDYHFLSDQDFDALLADGQMLEWAQYAGNRYGTPREPVEQRLATGVPVLLEIELQGARQVRQTMPQAVQVFLAPPSVDELRRRLTGRGTEAEDVLKARLNRAEVELAAADEFEHVIINSTVGQAVEALLHLVGPAPE